MANRSSSKQLRRSVQAWCIIAACLALAAATATADVVKVGLNYPKTGPYSAQGLDQWQAAEMAAAEINAAGGILGRQVEIVWRDSQSKPDVTRQNVAELINEGATMVFGGSSSAVAIAAGEVCHDRGVPFFGTLTYSNETTGAKGNRYVFRECYNAWMGAKALAGYLNQNFAGKKYLYITADYTWGRTTEASMRKFTKTEDTSVHKSIMTPFPGATQEDFKKAISFAKMVKPDVLVLVLFGQDMVDAIRLATAQGLKQQMQIVVPNLTLGMAEGGGPKVMEGVLGAVPWCWEVPYKYNYAKGKQFVETFAQKYNRYPCCSGGSAYTILYEYKDAVERAGNFDAPGVIRALEGHEYTALKDKQVWRDFDHQSVQTVYAVRCKPEVDVLKDHFKLDYFEILSAMPGDQAVQTMAEWTAECQAGGRVATRETLPGD
jgi:branched-chain amino acid transport system substrate-binding protein